jgi:hypothetical protein
LAFYEILAETHGTESGSGLNRLIKYLPALRRALGGKV